jgi:hypothetical protein
MFGSQITRIGVEITEITEQDEIKKGGGLYV